MEAETKAAFPLKFLQWENFHGGGFYSFFTELLQIMYSLNSAEHFFKGRVAVYWVRGEAGGCLSLRLTFVRAALCCFLYLVLMTESRFLFAALEDLSSL